MNGQRADSATASHRAEGDGRTTSPDASPRTLRSLLMHLAVPVALLVAALVLPSFMLTTTRPFRGAGLGPAAWPQFMLALVAICSLLWAGRAFIGWRRGGLEAESGEIAPSETYDYPKALMGLVLIVAYGWSLSTIGFPIATALFIVIWCVLGGVRNPLAVVPISMVGTVTLLWVFMGLALMPLSRGRGVFDTISIAVLRALGIY